MKRLFVNAFCPGKHKVVSMPERNPDLSRASSKVISGDIGRPMCPIRSIQTNEPTFAHQDVKLRSKRRSFRRPEIIVDHKPAGIVKQVTVAIPIPTHVIVGVENKKANLAAAEALMNLRDGCLV
jgi:hypothetical protein